ncbi:MAG TPA: LysR family transcriptional regulator [Syntrophorhabdales bacterium]|nr:LysR family transcriptional regulator [Syntrophorhabdales bacterium]
MLSYSLGSLIVFSKVVKYKSFSRAADALFMTQPGVSNHVAQLEAQAGLSLLRRDRGKFELTKEGKVVYRYAQKIEKVARELEDTLHALHNEIRPLLRVGTVPTYSRIMMPHVLGGFQKEYPGIKIKLDVGSSSEMEKSLLSGQNDIIIVASLHVSKKMQAFPAVREELVLIAAKNHPLTRKKAVSLSDVKAYPFIIREEGSATRDVVLSAFSKMDITPSVLIEAKSTEFIKEWVAQGKGVSVLIRRAVGGEEDKSITLVPLREPLFLEVSVLFLKARRYDPSIQKFVGHVKELRL